MNFLIFFSDLFKCPKTKKTFLGFPDVGNECCGCPSCRHWYDCENFSRHTQESMLLLYDQNQELYAIQCCIHAPKLSTLLVKATVTARHRHSPEPLTADHGLAYFARTNHVSKENTPTFAPTILLQWHPSASCSSSHYQPQYLFPIW